MSAFKTDGRSHVRPAVMVGASVVLVSILLSLVASEVILRTAFDPLRVLDGEPWWEYRWRQTHTASGTLTDSAEVYGSDVYDPQLGWKPRPDYRTAAVRTNSLGIRSVREFDFERAPGVSRIVVIGDSFLWGEGVGNEETFASHLDRRLADAEVINLAVHGYGTDQQLLRLQTLGFRFDPDIVILGFYEENMWRNALSFRDYAKPRYRLVREALVLENQPVPPPEAILAESQRLPRSFLLVLVRRVLRKASWNRGLGLAESEEWRTTRAILERAKSEIEARGSRLLLLYIPTSTLGEPGLAEGLVEAWAVRSETPFVNLRTRFQQLPDSQRVRLYDDHWTPYGHGVVAEIAASVISENALLVGVDPPPR